MRLPTRSSLWTLAWLAGMGLFGCASDEPVEVGRDDATRARSASVGTGSDDSDFALQAGQSNALVAPARPVCGTRGAQPCAKRSYCDFPAGSQCGATDLGGRCMPRPEGCTTEYDPVCGCDGKTYSNACDAHAAGASVASKGRCKADPKPGKPDGKACGGQVGAKCDDGEFCNFEGQQIACGAIDGPGVCERRPETCTEQYAPVCGCDGKTHGNLCSAHFAGVSVLDFGECAAGQKPLHCDHRKVRCRRAEPVCPAGQVASVDGGCWGPCVKLEACPCTHEDECPHREKWVCHKSAGHCGPYVN